MKELILHIGMPKTGTTSLQYFLSRNAQKLHDFGIEYRGYRGADRSHNFLAPLVHRGEWEKIDKFFAGLAETDSKKILVSCGRLFAFTAMKAKRHLDDDLINNFEEIEQAAIEGLMNIVTHYYKRVHVIAYLRRQDKVLESSYNQSVKNGTWKGGDIQVFLKYMQNRLEYDRIADRWARLIGNENLTLKIYERKNLYKADIRADFITQIGLPDDTLSYEITGGNKEENIRFPRDLLEYKAILNRIEMPRWRERQYKRALREVAAELDSDPEEWQDFLSPSERKEIISTFDETNRRLANKYFNLDKETPFDMSDLEDSTQQDPYPGLNTEKAIEIYLRLKRRLNALPYKLERTVYLLRDRVHSRAPFLRPLLSPFGRMHEHLK